MSTGEDNMKARSALNTYSEEITNRYLSKKKPIINISSELEVQYNWIDGKRMEEVTGYKLYFVQEGVNPFAVKFKNKPIVPAFLAEVEIGTLEAIEIRSHVYFRAESVQEK